MKFKPNGDMLLGLAALAGGLVLKVIEDKRGANARTTMKNELKEEILKELFTDKK